VLACEIQDAPHVFAVVVVGEEDVGGGVPGADDGLFLLSYGTLVGLHSRFPRD